MTPSRCSSISATSLARTGHRRRTGCRSPRGVEVLGGPDTHYLHLTEVGSALWRERLAFRDTLLATPALVAEYAALKLLLAAEHTQVQAYTDDKRAFVSRVLAGRGIALVPRPGASGPTR